MAIRYRDARPADSAAIIAFQCAMARETEDMELDAKICSRGVAGVFESEPPPIRDIVIEEESCHSR